MAQLPNDVNVLQMLLARSGLITDLKAEDQVLSKKHSELLRCAVWAALDTRRCSIR